MEQLIEQLHISHQHLAQRLSSFAHDQDSQPAPDQWSFRELAAHLAEAEEDCLWKRIQLIASGSQPHFASYENSGDDFSQLDLLDSLERWAKTRRKVIDFVARLSADQSAYTATHAAFGTITIADYLREFHQHDVEHLHELETQLAE
jgi:DinB superfamily